MSYASSAARIRPACRQHRRPGADLDFVDRYGLDHRAGGAAVSAPTPTQAELIAFTECRIAWAEDSASEGSKASLPALRAILATLNAHAQLVAQRDALVRAVEKAVAILEAESTNRLHRSRDGVDRELPAINALRTALALSQPEKQS
jgi:hypothetical protein